MSKFGQDNVFFFKCYEIEAHISDWNFFEIWPEDNTRVKVQLVQVFKANTDHLVLDRKIYQGYFNSK